MSTKIARDRVEKGILAVDLFMEMGLCKSKAETVKAFKRGFGWIGERRLVGPLEVIRLEDFNGDEAVIRVGKRRRHNLKIED